MRILPRTLSAAADRVVQQIASPSLTRRTHVTVEREFVSLRHEAAGDRRDFCPMCKQEVNMLTPEAAACTADTSIRKVYRWIEENLVHFSEQPSGKVLICSASLRGRYEATRFLQENAQ